VIPARQLLLALLLVLRPVLAQPAPDQRIVESRELVRFDPAKVLAQLLEPQPQMSVVAPRTQAERLVLISLAHGRLHQADAALATAEQVIAYGKSLHDDVILAEGMLAKAVVLDMQEKPEDARPQGQAAERLAFTTDSQALQARVLIANGQFDSYQGNFLSAMGKLQKAIDLARQQKEDPTLPAKALKALITLYLQTKDRGKAIATLAELAAETSKLSSAELTIEFKNLEFRVNSAFGEPAQARQALVDSLVLIRARGFVRALVGPLVNLSDSYLRGGDYAQAARYAAEALSAAIANKSAFGEAKARINLGHAYLGLGRVAEGRATFDAGIAHIEKLDDKPELQAALLEYGQALERAGEMGGAVKAYHRERAISNELFEAQQRKSLLELQQKYEMEKKERQIELLKKENLIKDADIEHHRLQQRLWWLLAAVLAVTAAVVGMLYRRVRYANARLKESNLSLKLQSTLDPLTLLYNRRHFHDFMAGLDDGGPAAADRRPPRDDDITGALFLLDVDHFKSINDTYGHAAGDAVLKMIAANLRAALRETDMIVRWGGEEFLAFLPAVQRSRIDEVAQRILRAMSAQPLRYREHEITVRVSVGFSPFPLVASGAPLGWERIVNLADMALYLAKANGRNRSYGVSGLADIQTASMDAIERDLEGAWRAGHVNLDVVLG
jgi:diguanylate cyclase (GGDEF)-like protein